MSGVPAGVDFFERQHAARGTTVKLVSLFALAVLAIVAVIDMIVWYAAHTMPTSSVIGWLVAATLLTLLIITGGTVAKMVALRGGGAAVAKSVGAVPVDPTTTDPQLRRFVNVVEEMSIASGVPMPRLFVLESEDGINAFAAGYSPADAAITVTAGALHQLNRDELQGVIGHEFSHVLNGDMRLNVRLIGLLSGILLLGIVGLRILQFGGGGRSRNSKNDGAAPILVLAIAMLILGFVGQFFAGLIQAAVSRQREWLADASSVQFTRQTSGLVGALKKIAGVPTGSTLRNAAGEKQVSHMLFGDGRKFSGLWATHPPLVKRIQALEPGFRPEEVAQLRAQYGSTPPDGLAEDARLGLTDTAPRVARAAARVDPATVARRVGTFTAADLEHGAALSAQLPPQLRQLAAQPTTAGPLLIALLLDSDGTDREQRLGLVAQALGPAAASAVEGLLPVVANVPRLLQLPLVGLAVGPLTTRPVVHLDAFVDLLERIALADGRYTMFEYCLTRLVGSYVRDALDPKRRSTPGRGSAGSAQQAATTLLAVIAQTGNPDPGTEQRAFQAGVQRLGLPPTAYAPPADFARALDAGWAPLDALDPRFKRPLIEAIVAAIAADGELAVPEAELLRTTCALLHCPLPQLLG